MKKSLFVAQARIFSTEDRSKGDSQQKNSNPPKLRRIKKLYGGKERRRLSIELLNSYIP